METPKPIESIAPPAPISPSAGPTPHQFRQLLRAVLVLAGVVATIQSLELWRCWQARPAAHQAAQLRANLQHLGSIVEEYRQVSARNPDLVAIGRKYGVEPLAGALGTAAMPLSSSTNRSAGRP